MKNEHEKKGKRKRLIKKVGIKYSVGENTLINCYDPRGRRRREGSLRRASYAPKLVVMKSF